MRLSFLHPRTSTTARRATSAAAAVALIAGLGACSTTTDPGTTDSASSQSTASATDTSTSAADTSTSASDGAGISQGAPADGSTPILGDAWTNLVAEKQPGTGNTTGLVLHEIRVGEHTDYYRVVIEFTGTGEPGWWAQWADSAIEQGRGEPLPLTTPTVLDLTITGTMMPGDESRLAEYYSGPKIQEVGPVQVVVDGTFEADTHIALGMDKKRMHQVGLLTDPVRVVIDVKK